MNWRLFGFYILSLLVDCVYKPCRTIRGVGSLRVAVLRNYFVVLDLLSVLTCRVVLEDFMLNLFLSRASLRDDLHAVQASTWWSNAVKVIGDPLSDLTGIDWNFATVHEGPHIFDRLLCAWLMLLRQNYSSLPVKPLDHLFEGVCSKWFNSCLPFCVRHVRAALSLLVDATLRTQTLHQRFLFHRCRNYYWELF